MHFVELILSQLQPNLIFGLVLKRPYLVFFSNGVTLWTEPILILHISLSDQQTSFAYQDNVVKISDIMFIYLHCMRLVMFWTLVGM
jgi:hypothetical protein